MQAQKPTYKAFAADLFRAEVHVREELDRVFDTCTPQELNNLIHNLETIQAARVDAFSHYEHLYGCKTGEIL